MPNSRDHLSSHGILKVETLYEGEHVRSVHDFSGVVVAPFGDVAKEWGIPKGWRGLPVPLPWVPWEILDEPSFEDPVERGLLAWSLQIPGHFEGRPRSFLGKDSDRAEVCRGDGENLVSRGLDVTIGRDFLEFYHVGLTWCGFEHKVNPVEWGARVRSWIVDSVSCLRVADAFIWVPLDAGSDDILASFV